MKINKRKIINHKKNFKDKVKLLEVLIQKIKIMLNYLKKKREDYKQKQLKRD